MTDPSLICAVCGHHRGEHEHIERQWCGRCASMARSDILNPWHTFEPRGIR